MKNKIEIKNNVVIKTYTSRIDYVKEESVYQKLKGTGLAPELIDSRDGYLEHKYVEGSSLLDAINQANGDKAVLAEYIKRFCIWYKQYRDLTKLTLGVIRLDKFILTEDGLCYLDFENCKPGYMEDDLARIICDACMNNEPFSDEGIEFAQFFICQAAQYFEWIPEILAASIPREFMKECRKRNILPIPKKIEYITTLLTTCGVVFGGGRTDITDCTSLLEYMPERIVDVPSGRSGNITADVPGFTMIRSKVGIDNTMERIVETQKNTKQVWSLYLTTDMPKIPKILWDELLSTEKDSIVAVVIEAGGKLREFPLLLNTAGTRIELQHALVTGKTSITDVLKDMNIRIVRVEDIK